MYRSHLYYFLRVGQSFDFIIKAENVDCINACESGIYTLTHISGIVRNSLPTLKQNSFNDF